MSDQIVQKFQNQLFIDVFNPNKLSGFGLPPRLNDRFSVKPDTNFICSGPRGRGKSSIIKFLLKLHNIPYRYINCGESGNIDTLRDEIDSFCTEIQLVDTPDGPKRSEIKYVFFDEIDGSSAKFFDGLKGAMDVNSKTTRFCATTNYYHKLPDPIKSRFEHINFEFQNDEEREVAYRSYSNRMKAIIMKSLESSIEEDVFQRMINMHFPDYRGILQELEKLYRMNIRNITNEIYFTKTVEHKDLFDLICTNTDPADLYKKIVGKYALSAIDVMDSLHKYFIPYVEQYHATALRAIPNIIVTIWEHQNSLPNVIDPAICLESCAFKLNQIILNAKK